MFVGHYAAALAAKAAEPKAPMWALIGGSQLIDIGWSILVITGLESGRVDPSLPGSSFVLEHMPWTHSLPGVLVWSLATMLAARYLLRLSWTPAIAIAAVVFSHWLLDLVVHRPDLELFPGGLKAGFGLWNFPVPEQAVEIGLIAIAGVFWSATRTRAGQRAWPAAAFVALLVGIQIVAMQLPQETSNSLAGAGLNALGVYLLITVVAVFLDARRANRSQPRP